MTGLKMAYTIIQNDHMVILEREGITPLLAPQDHKDNNSFYSHNTNDKTHFSLKDTGLLK
jgi:hypothetical protein